MMTIDAKSLVRSNQERMDLIGDLCRFAGLNYTYNGVSMRQRPLGYSGYKLSWNVCSKEHRKEKEEYISVTE